MTHTIPDGYCQCGCGAKAGVYPRTDSASGRVKGEYKRYILHHQWTIPNEASQYRQWWEDSTDIPYGFCWCGCGRKTPLAVKTIRPKNYVKGQPVRCLDGHRRPVKLSSLYTIEDRGFDTPCWIWQGRRDRKGYGEKCLWKRWYKAHRLMYKRKNGPIPYGYDIHHRCETPPCVNPDHLQAVTPQEHRRLRKTNKLTLEDANAIRRAYAKGGITIKKLAEQRGVSDALVQGIIANTVWRN